MAVNVALRLMHLGVPGGIVGGGVGYLFTSSLQMTGRLPVGELYSLIGAVLLGTVGWGANYLLMRSGDALASALGTGSGDTTAYTPTFSHIEAMEIRGDIEGAAKAWDEACAEHPASALVWIKAGDFHLRLRKDPAAALERYRPVRDFPTASADSQRYVASKMVDLYLGPLGDEGRAMGEMRRLIDRFPDSREAKDAREVLMRLKAERARE